MTCYSAYNKKTKDQLMADVNNHRRDFIKNTSVALGQRL